jgi:Flp pilus assembly protein TadD
MEPAMLSSGIRCFEDALRLSPYNVDIRNDLAQWLSDAGRDEEARRQLETSAALDPNYAFTHYRLGLAWLKLAEKDRARQAFMQALRIQPGFRAAEEQLRASAEP